MRDEDPKDIKVKEQGSTTTETVSDPVENPAQPSAPANPTDIATPPAETPTDPKKDKLFTSKH